MPPFGDLDPEVAEVTPVAVPTLAASRARSVLDPFGGEIAALHMVPRPLGVGRWFG